MCANKVRCMNKSLAQLFGTLALALIIESLHTGCSERSAPTESSPQVPATSPPGFINIVWKVSESPGVAPGTLYVFLSDGTLVVASPHGKPAVGTWRDAGGVLTMVEEGLPYQVDVLNVSHDEFRIRSHHPGKPAEITFVPAEKPPRGNQ
jgi:hypothetical protein